MWEVVIMNHGQCISREKKEIIQQILVLHSGFLSSFLNANEAHITKV